MGRREHQSDTMAKKKTKMNMARIAMIATITRFKVCCTIAHANNMLVPIILVTSSRNLPIMAGWESRERGGSAEGQKGSQGVRS